MLFTYALAVLIASIPLTRGIEVLSHALMERKEKDLTAALPWNSPAAMKKLLPDSDGLEEYIRPIDEMLTVQTRLSKLLKAARLRRIQERTDLVLPLQEAEMLQAVINRKKKLAQAEVERLNAIKRSQGLLVESDHRYNQRRGRVDKDSLSTKMLTLNQSGKASLAKKKGGGMLSFLPTRMRSQEDALEETMDTSGLDGSLTNEEEDDEDEEEENEEDEEDYDDASSAGDGEGRDGAAMGRKDDEIRGKVHFIGRLEKLKQASPGVGPVSMRLSLEELRGIDLYDTGHGGDAQDPAMKVYLGPRLVGQTKRLKDAGTNVDWPEVFMGIELTQDEYLGGIELRVEVYNENITGFGNKPIGQGKVALLLAIPSARMDKYETVTVKLGDGDALKKDPVKARGKVEMLGLLERPPPSAAPGAKMRLSLDALSGVDLYDTGHGGDAQDPAMKVYLGPRLVGQTKRLKDAGTNVDWPEMFHDIEVTEAEYTSGIELRVEVYNENITGFGNKPIGGCRMALKDAIPEGNLDLHAPITMTLIDNRKAATAASRGTVEMHTLLERDTHTRSSAFDASPSPSASPIPVSTDATVGETGATVGKMRLSLEKLRGIDLYDTGHGGDAQDPAMKVYLGPRLVGQTKRLKDAGTNVDWPEMFRDIEVTEAEYTSGIELRVEVYNENITGFGNKPIGGCRMALKALVPEDSLNKPHTTAVKLVDLRAAAAHDPRGIVQLTGFMEKSSAPPAYFSSRVVDAKSLPWRLRLQGLRGIDLYDTGHGGDAQDPAMKVYLGPRLVGQTKRLKDAGTNVDWPEVIDDIIVADDDYQSGIELVIEVYNESLTGFGSKPIGQGKVVLREAIVDDAAVMTQGTTFAITLAAPPKAEKTASVLQKLINSSKKQTSSRSEKDMFGQKRRPRTYGAVMRARRKAQAVKGEVQMLPTDEEKELYLMKAFILEHLSGYQRGIAQRYLLSPGKFQSGRYATSRAVMRVMAMVLLPLLYTAMFYAVYYCNSTMGSRSATFWLVACLIAVAQDALVLQPFRIWLKWIIIPAYVSQDVRELCHSIRLRFNSILLRRAGAMRDATAMVQHLNPACRVARLFPHLPVSRFLISLNDFDVPHLHKKAEGVEHSSWLRWGLHAVSVTLPVIFLTLLTSIPLEMSDAVVDLAVSLLINLTMYIVYQLGTVSVFVAIFVVAALLGGTVALNEVYYRAKSFKWKRPADDDDARPGSGSRGLRSREKPNGHRPGPPMEQQYGLKSGSSFGSLGALKRGGPGVGSMRSIGSAAPSSPFRAQTQTQKRGQMTDKKAASPGGGDGSIQVGDDFGLGETVKEEEKEESVLLEEFISELDSTITFRPLYKAKPAEITLGTRMKGMNPFTFSRGGSSVVPSGQGKYEIDSPLGSLKKSDDYSNSNPGPNLPQASASFADGGAEREAYQVSRSLNRGLMEGSVESHQSFRTDPMYGSSMGMGMGMGMGAGLDGGPSVGSLSIGARLAQPPRGRLAPLAPLFDAPLSPHKAYPDRSLPDRSLAPPVAGLEGSLVESVLSLERSLAGRLATMLGALSGGGDGGAVGLGPDYPNPNPNRDSRRRSAKRSALRVSDTTPRGSPDKDARASKPDGGGGWELAAPGKHRISGAGGGGYTGGYTYTDDSGSSAAAMWAQDTAGASIAASGASSSSQARRRRKARGESGESAGPGSSRRGGTDDDGKLVLEAARPGPGLRDAARAGAGVMRGLGPVARVGPGGRLQSTRSASPPKPLPLFYDADHPETGEFPEWHVKLGGYYGGEGGHSP